MTSTSTMGRGVGQHGQFVGERPHLALERGDLGVAFDEELTRLGGLDGRTPAAVGRAPALDGMVRHAV